ncbi:MAG: hypothetical protein B7Y47_00055 [Sphingomonas sp. 28-63-12]|nr:MAG: hypothetical protein B7Y47_00055 [Sphingomonas sp. 28-63-12]
MIVTQSRGDAIVGHMNRDDDVISAAMRAANPHEDIQLALKPFGQVGSIMDMLRPHRVPAALVASTPLENRSIAAMLAAATGSSALSEQMKSCVDAPGFAR